MTRRSFWDEIKDIRWETDSSTCIARTRRPIVKQNIDFLMQESNITICNDPSRRKFDFHVKVFDKDGKFIVRSVSFATRKNAHLKKRSLYPILENYGANTNRSESSEVK